jgi:hypothetical protein
MRPNVGTIDRSLRIIAGFALIALAALGKLGWRACIGIVPLRLIDAGQFLFTSSETLWGFAAEESDRWVSPPLSFTMRRSVRISRRIVMTSRNVPGLPSLMKWSTWQAVLCTAVLSSLAGINSATAAEAMTPTSQVQFGGQCTEGLAEGRHVMTNCTTTWTDKDGKMTVDQTKVHKVPELKTGQWIQVPRYEWKELGSSHVVP